MKAIVKSSPSPGIEVREVEPPRPQPGEVLVRVEAVGICGSDIHIYEWTPGYDFLSKYFPLTLGHEFAGQIMESRGGSFRSGEKVTSETGRICGKCFFCKQGKGILCALRTSFGRIGLERNGAMAEYVVVHEDCLHRIPPGVTQEEAAMTEPAAVALGAVELAHFYPGDVVVILGPGPIGLLILQMCKALGAGKVGVFGLEADRPRLRVAETLGADFTLIGENEDSLKKIMDLTEGLGAGVVFEVSGSPAAAVPGLQMVRKAGEMILVGIYPGPIPVDATHQMVRQMKTIKGSYGGASLDWDRVLKLVAARKINLAPLISRVLPLEQAKEGFEAVLNRNALKVILKTNQ
ncbi:MAG TPA: alcohol dehydrogenase catalytic domain-containing protein [Thermodesulfobacteriota bacterium]|nr:alcohol dehydrogenase catalytic domain-containing protein [Thermodesulfobacteriota bacterium]